jgi:hypothetical protein
VASKQCACAHCVGKRSAQQYRFCKSDCERRAATEERVGATRAVAASHPGLKVMRLRALNVIGKSFKNAKGRISGRSAAMFAITTQKRRALSAKRKSF